MLLHRVAGELGVDDHLRCVRRETADRPPLCARALRQSESHVAPRAPRQLSFPRTVRFGFVL